MSIGRNPQGDEHDRWVDAGLAGLREEVRRVSAPRSVERELRARLRADRLSRLALPWWRTVLQQFVVPALAFGIVLALFLPMLSEVTLSPEISGEANLTTQADINPFYALSSGRALPAQQRGVVVATEIPSQVLLDFGLPIDPEQVGRPVKADVLVGVGGEILGVRFDNELGESK